MILDADRMLGLRTPAGPAFASPGMELFLLELRQEWLSLLIETGGVVDRSQLSAPIRERKRKAAREELELRVVKIRFSWRSAHQTLRHFKGADTPVRGALRPRKIRGVTETFNIRMAGNFFLPNCQHQLFGPEKSGLRLRATSSGNTLGAIIAGLFKSVDEKDWEYPRRIPKADAVKMVRTLKFWDHH